MKIKIILFTTIMLVSLNSYSNIFIRKLSTSNTKI